jgi:ethanolamine ammonia-lyase small subunit
MAEELAPFPRQALGVKNPYNAEALAAMKAATPARICVGRVGPRPPVEAWLSFRWDEGLARDAVWGRVPDELLKEVGIEVRVDSACESKQDYLAHPESGGELAEAAEKTLLERCKMSPDVQVFVTDGLSSLAVEANLKDLLPALRDGFEGEGLKMGTPFFVDMGRVRLLNAVGRILKPKVAVNLIGERPGLVTQTCISAYLAYQPKPGDTDAERNCISNIYDKGLNPLEAAAQIVDMAMKMIDQKVSGTKLKL